MRQESVGGSDRAQASVGSDQLGSYSEFNNKINSAGSNGYRGSETNKDGSFSSGGNVGSRQEQQGESKTNGGSSEKTWTNFFSF